MQEVSSRSKCFLCWDFLSDRLKQWSIWHNGCWIPIWNSTFLSSPLSHHEATKRHWSSSCKHYYVFLPCMPREKVRVCVCLCVCECVHMFAPISPLSLSPHIQMSLHLSCKCECVCVSFICICVRAHLCVNALQVHCIRLCVRVCVCDQIVMQVSLTMLPVVPEPELRGPALSPGVDKRPLFKECWGKMARPCQSRTNSLLTPWASLLEQFKERKRGRKRERRERASGFLCI